jgi:hypothetical protein
MAGVPGLRVIVDGGTEIRSEAICGNGMRAGEDHCALVCALHGHLLAPPSLHLPLDGVDWRTAAGTMASIAVARGGLRRLQR